MKLYCLSGNPNRPCFILKFKGTTIMLDCGLDVSTLMLFLPIPLLPCGKFSKLPGWSPRDVTLATKVDEELKEAGGKVFVDSEPEFRIPEIGMIDMSEVDVILLSNYHSMLALPFITEYTKFNGTVYATDPTLHIGRQYMEEIVSYIQSIPKLRRATKWKEKNILNYLPPPLSNAVSSKAWRRCYNKHDIQSSLSKVHTIGFSEKFDIFGSMEVTATSSGYCIGSCNWVIQSDHEKIAYVSGSSTLTTHPRPLDQKPLRNCDLLLMSGLTQTPTVNPDAMIGEFCVNTAVTLRNGGNVLVPCYPSGVTYDLFECLSGHLDNVGLGSVPLYFISPVADSSLAYSNIYAEWLSSAKQNKIYLPEHPFPHAELVKNNRLKHYPSIHRDFNQDLKTPCVIFTGHPSLRFGNVVHFVELWGKSNSNTIIFTEPDFPYLDALAPYQPVAMKVAYCPIDTSLSFSQANKLIKDLKPLHLVLSEQYSSPPVLLPNRTDLVIDCEPKPITFKRASVLKLPVKRVYETIDIHPDLAGTLMPKEVKPNVGVAMVTGSLVNDDNKYTLKPIGSGPAAAKKRKTESPLGNTKCPVYVYGLPDVQKFVSMLKEAGYTDAKAEEAHPGHHIVHLPSEDSLIQIEPTSTHIIVMGNETLRLTLRDTLLKCLGKL